MSTRKVVGMELDGFNVLLLEACHLWQMKLPCS
jgi:hypothetical protein